MKCASTDEEYRLFIPRQGCQALNVVYSFCHPQVLKERRRLVGGIEAKVDQIISSSFAHHIVNAGAIGDT